LGSNAYAQTLEMWVSGEKYSEVGAIMDEISSAQIMNGIEKLQQVEKLKFKYRADIILQEYHPDKTIKAFLNAK